MNPDTQLLLEEIRKLSVEQTVIQQKLIEQKDFLERRFTEVDDNIDLRFQEAELVVEQRIIDSELRQDVRLQAIEKTTADLGEWRRDHEGVVDDMRLRLGKLDKFWARSVLETASPFTEPGIFTDPNVKSEQHAAPTSAGYQAARPIGHRVDLHHLEDGHGVVTTHVHSPVTGMDALPETPPRIFGTAPDLFLSRNRPPETHYNPTGKLPKLSFPSFDGTDLKLWITMAEDYFSMYSVQPSVWIQCARMQFLGSAKRWVQSVTEELKSWTWSEFCQALHSRFDRDQHTLLLRQMNRIRQQTTVQDYVDRFAELVDQLKAYESPPSALHYVTRFIDGLKSDIRAVLLVHRPTTLDTAYTLATLQEEAGEYARRADSRSWTPRTSYQRGDRSAAGEVDKQALQPKAIDKRLADLKAYRRAKGLCDHCGDKWSRDHKCAAKVGLHVLDELYAVIAAEDSVDASDPEEVEDTLADEQCCSLSAVSTASKGVRTLQFQGILRQQAVLILLDSGSTSSFISSQLVSQLSLPVSHSAPVAVRIADGHTMHCSSVVKSVTWTIQQYQFQHDLKVLPIPQYDIILGMDWLQLFSPMKVDWNAHWLSIPYHGHTIQIHGNSDSEGDNPFQFLIQLLSLEVSDRPDSSVCPSAVSDLLAEFPSVTTPPDSLPPRRQCDHVIPLVEGARPVSIRPYRYPPALKDEIEAQVATMLKQGIIQHSSSPFNSPVLLVRKKDGSWRN
jgi:hypothetical protein